MTAPASAPALRIFAGTTEAAFQRMGERAGIPAQCLRGNRVRRRAFGRASGHRGACGQADEADMERELSGARIVVDATHPFATLATTSAAFAAVGARCLRLARPVEALPKGVVFRSRRIACAARFLSRTRVARFSRRGARSLLPTRASPISRSASSCVCRCPVL